MNFLAHAVLAGSNAEIVAGSLAGDFVKGVVRDGDYPTNYLLGIRLHRRLDAFSNQEPALRRSANRLPSDLKRIAPPCIDMIADHFLAQAVEQDAGAFLTAFENQPDSAASLHSYETALHGIVSEHQALLSSSAQRFFTHADTTRLFSDYRHFERIAKGIDYLCGRMGRAEAGPAMVAALHDQQRDLHEDFCSYWPALQAEASRFLHSQQQDRPG